MTTQAASGDDAPRQMTCVRRLYVMEDDTGRTWLAAEQTPGGPPGGGMSHLVPGETSETEGDDPDQVTVLVPAKPGGMPHRMPTYRISAGLLPPDEDPAEG